MLILTRTACLGGDTIYNKLGNRHNFTSQGKVRVDLLMDIVKGKINKPDSNILSGLISRPDMLGVYGQQCELSWLSITEEPFCLIMDNYSELTDKRFHHQDGWDFCGLYGDLRMDEHDSQITCLGLLDDVESSYDEFFTWVKKKWNIPIVFLHFPSIQETRKEYLEQHQKITQAMDKLASKHNIQNIHADPSEIESISDGDAYHFSKRTAVNLASKISLPPWIDSY